MDLGTFGAAGFAVTASLINTTDAKAVHAALHPTGEFSARFMIVAMMASPLALIFKGWRGAALVHFAPLGLLEAYRIWYWYLRPRPARAA